MDEIVLRAMAKWPNVPAVHGWLALNRRGQWLIKGDRISHPVIVEFIGRNYGRDERGRWYFQNGPQRVYVTLAYTPLVLRYPGTGYLVTHVGCEVHRLDGGWVDSDGVLLFATEYGPGMIDDRDVETLSTRLTDRQGRKLDDDGLLESIERMQQGKETGLTLAYAGADILMRPIDTSHVPGRFGFIAGPLPAEGEEACA